jgi:hypothetical protein
MGLAEGRTGGPQAFETFLLLTNPDTRPAAVRVAYLRDNGAPIVEDYVVAPSRRLSIAVAAVEGLRDASLGTLIESTNHVPIVVERSM